MADLNFSWDQVVKLSRGMLQRQQLPELYRQRLDYELAEIDKQGSNQYWLGLINGRKQFTDNPNRLLLPWLLGMLVCRQGEQYVKLDQQQWLAADPIAGRLPADGPLLTSSTYRQVMAVWDRDGKLPVDIVQDADKPDIDLDCLPEARDRIKEYAATKYGEQTQGLLPDAARDYGYVCSVGTWQTYLLRSAILDSFKTMGMGSKDVVLATTTQLPDEVDELKEGGFASCKNRVPGPRGEQDCGTVYDGITCPTCGSESSDAPTINRLLRDHTPLREFNLKFPQVVTAAVGLVGRIKSMGQHAGGLIIADRPLYGNIPLHARTVTDKRTKQKVTNYVSMWSEGRSTQLSKFGYNKWDILGLKNLKYIKTCCELIRSNRGVSFGDNLEGWDDIDPERDMAGWYIKDGKKYKVSMNDPRALALANAQLTDGIFQFDTPLAKQILGNGVRNFNDLMLFNAMGHPGPMDSIPEAVANRDSQDHEVWQQRLRDLHPDFLHVLKETYGVIVYQEDLAALWQLIAGFTSPEAQDARKAIAKKWRHLLEPIEKRWMEGASKKIGEAAAREWWAKQVSFGRYAFNKCLDQDTQLTDPTTGTTKTVEQWYNDGDLVALPAWDGGAVVSDECVAIHPNGEQEVFEVEFDTGHKEWVTIHHRFLCTDGEYHEVGEIFDQGLEVCSVQLGRGD